MLRIILYSNNNNSNNNNKEFRRIVFNLLIAIYYNEIKNSLVYCFGKLAKLLLYNNNYNNNASVFVLLNRLHCCIFNFFISTFYYFLSRVWLEETLFKFRFNLLRTISIFS